MSEPSEYEIIARFRDAMRQASGCAWQLAHARRDPTWLAVRRLLEAVSERATKLVEMRAMTERNVLAALDFRLRARDD